MKRLHGEFLISIALLLVLLAVIWRGGEQSDAMNTVQIIRIILGSIALLFLPWYWLTKALFAAKELDALEMIALSFAFSISVVPLLVFYANLAGVPITARLVIAVCALVVWGSYGYLLYRHTKPEHVHSHDLQNHHHTDPHPHHHQK